MFKDGLTQNKKYGTILADPPWQFSNRTGKTAPEHKRLARYTTLSLKEIKEIPVSSIALENSHLYLWVPNALLTEGLQVMEAWGFQYKTNIIRHGRPIQIIVKNKHCSSPNNSGIRVHIHGN